MVCTRCAVPNVLHTLMVWVRGEGQDGSKRREARSRLCRHAIISCALAAAAAAAESTYNVLLSVTVYASAKMSMSSVTTTYEPTSIAAPGRDESTRAAFGYSVDVLLLLGFGLSQTISFGGPASVAAVAAAAGSLFEAGGCASRYQKRRAVPSCVTSHCHSVERNFCA